MERSSRWKSITTLCVLVLTAVPSATASASEPPTVRGTAVTGDGLEPVPHARVRTPGGTTTTDSHGRFALRIPAGEVTITAPGLPPWTLRGIREDADVTALLGQRRTMTAAPRERNNAERQADQRVRAESCSGHPSDNVPPANIRILIHGAHDPNGWGIPGTEQGVRTVPFRSYVENVLPAEWPAEWPEQSLRAGAMAVKNYGWYWAQHWRGGEFEGECFDVDDSIAYQRYVPGNNAASTTTAIATTWNKVAHKDAGVFSTGYRATLTGDPNEPCGAGREQKPDLLSQWGSRACALEGRGAEEILSLYYPGSVVR